MIHEDELALLEEAAPQDFSAEVEAARAAEEEAFAESSPVGDFTAEGLSALGSALSDIAPLFDAEFEVEIPEDTSRIPNDALRLLSAVSEASKDAASANRIDPELVVEFDGVSTDDDLFLLAGTITQLSRDLGFKQFLGEDSGEDSGEEPVEEEPAEDELAEEAVEDEMPRETTDEIFMSAL